MINLDSLISPPWQTILAPVNTHLKQLNSYLHAEYLGNHTIYPPISQVFYALEKTPPDQVKVVILGQDPYAEDNKAHGLSFSVPLNQPCPPSLRNIFKALENDLEIQNVSQDLTPWANQGVLLLNSILTVRKHQPLSHQNKGWEIVTNHIISHLSQTKIHLIFMLWGKEAQKKTSLIDQDKHLILTAPHPSPLSAYRGFLHCKHFSQANQHLTDHNQAPIAWV